MGQTSVLALRAFLLAAYFQANCLLRDCIASSHQEPGIHVGTCWKLNKHKLH